MQNLRKFPYHLAVCMVIVFIACPFLLFIFKAGALALPEFSKIVSCLFFTLWQAVLSVILSWAFAVPASLGLIAFYNKPFYSILEWIYLLPLFLPPLVLAGGMMNILEYTMIPPFGWGPIIAGHVFTYSGGMAVLLARLLMAKTSSYCEWAVVHSVSAQRLIITLIRYVLRRDIQLISLTVFGFCFTSFSLPILLGGMQWKTLEVVIYDYLKNPSDWSMALGLLSIETGFVFILSFFIFKPPSFLKKLKTLHYLSWKKGLVLGLIPCFIIVISLMEGIYYIPMVFGIDGFFKAVLSTLFLSLSVGAGTILLFMIISLLYSYDYLRKFLLGYAAPSVVLTGFAFLVFLDNNVYLSWVLGLMILFLPALYRWAGESFLSSLQNQLQTAQTLGADIKMIFKRIIYPQCIHKFFFLGGVAGFWAGGDFAYTMITAQGKTHLALLAQQLLGRYRTEQGLAVIWILLFVGSFSFLFFKHIPFYCSVLKKRKFIKHLPLRKRE